MSASQSLDVSSPHARGAFALAPGARQSLHYALFAALVFGCAYGGLWLTAFTGRVAVIWVANAVVCAVMLKSDRRAFWPLMLIATLAAIAGSAAFGDAPSDAILLALCNSVEIALMVLLLRRAAGPVLDRATPQLLWTFFALAIGPAPMASALLGAAEQSLIRGQAFWPVAVHWYLGDAFGLLVLLPPLLTARLRDFRAMVSVSQLPGTMLALSGLAAAVIVNLIFRHYPLAYLFFPAVLLLTFTRGFAGGTLGTLVADAYLLLPALAGHGEIIPASPMRDQVMVILGFAAVLSFTVVLTGTALAHRRRLERGLGLALERAEEAVEEAVVARDAAERANRSKSMFLANMSHELRTPLNAVIGFSEVMKSEMFGPLGHTNYVEYSGLIHEAGSHLLDLINDVLDMSKIEAGKFEIEKKLIDVVPVVEDCLRLMQERAHAGAVRLLREVPSDPFMLFVDRRAFKQILLNLLSNAVKFTPRDGTVTVTLRRDLARRCCVLTVRDTGVGIPTEAISRLGNPFVQARGDVAIAHEGTGLGLALVRALSRMHDGIMRIESDLGAGTVVTVELPLGVAVERAA